MFIKTENDRIINASTFIIDESYIEVDFNYYDFIEKPQNYYLYVNDEIVENPNYEKEEQEKERERINHLSLTKREVFLALYNDKGLTPDNIRSQITNTQALIEFDYASEYFRGNPLIEQIGLMLGYTKEDLDYLFINKELPPKNVE